MATLSRSTTSFIWILILAVIATALFAGVGGYYSGRNALGGAFSIEQLQYIDGLVYGSMLKTEYDQWAANKEEAPPNDLRQHPANRCAGKFFPDAPVAMKGCLAALQPRPEKGYQYPI